MTTKRQREMVNYLLAQSDSGKALAPDVETAVFVLDTLLVNYHHGWQTVRVPVDQKIELSVDAGGTIRTFSWLAFLNALDGLEVARFRRCVVCNKRFYAAREDARCCSQLHNSRLRQQEYRHPPVRYSDYEHWISTFPAKNESRKKRSKQR